VLAWHGAAGSPTDLHVERASPADADAVLGSMRRAFAQYRGVLQPPSSALDEQLQDVQAAMARGGAFVAREGGSIVGSARYQLREGHAYAERVAVDPGARGRGVGTALMRAIEAAARAAGHAEVWVSVRASLPENLRFYETLGYRTRESRPHPRGADVEVTLSRRLGPI